MVERLPRGIGGFVVRLAIVALLAALTACPRLVAPIRGSLGNSQVQGLVAPHSAVVSPIRGRVDFGPPSRQVQATMTEIQNACTVSLIDTSTGYTVATTLTDSSGTFQLNFPAGWSPTPGTVYYLEAIKGLSSGTSFPNRVGAEAVRVRTLVSVSSIGTWTSIVPGTNIPIDETTTALCVILSLRSLTPASAGRQITPSSLIGIDTGTGATTTQPDIYSYANTSLLPASMVTDTYQFVLEALRTDRDPFDCISLVQTDPLYNTVALDTSTLAIGAINPDVQIIGQPVTVIGSGFDPQATNDVVAFTAPAGATVSAPISTVSPDGSRITVTVPTGTVAGPIAVTVDNRLMPGPWFYPAPTTGHLAVDDSGNLYVANQSFGTIVKVSPTGAISNFVTGLDNPRNLTLYNGVMYVTCVGNTKGVVWLDLADPAASGSYSATGYIGDPRGLAFDASGTLWISDGANNKLWTIAATGSTPAAFSMGAGPGLNNPHAITFGPDGDLYVANYGANTVLQINPTSGASANFLNGLSQPWSVTFDSLGNLYVGNNAGNSIYRWQKSTGTLAPFASVPSPGGMVADRAGYLYAIDNKANNVYRITPAGDSTLFASGFSSPTGIVKVGSTIYVLSNANNSLVQVDTTTGQLTTLARGFNQPFGIAFEPPGGPGADASGDFFVSNVGDGTISRVNVNTGSSTTVLTGTGPAWGGASGITYYNGRLYMRNDQLIESYDVTNFATAPQTYQSMMQWNQGLSKDVDPSSPNYGSFYIASSQNRILRVVGDGQDWGSIGAGNYVVDFVDAAQGSNQDTNLDNPVDVTVDGAGNVWVVNNANRLLTSYTPAGAKYLPPISLGVNPLGINVDPSGSVVWVTAHDAGTITGYNTTTGVVTTTITTTGFNPRNLVIVGSTMYVTSDQGILAISNYSTSPSVANIYPGLAGYNGISVDGSGNLYVMNGAGRKVIDTAGTYTQDVAWTQNYQSENYIYQPPGSGQFFLSRSNGFVDASDYSYRLLGVINWVGGPQLAGVDSNGNLYANAVASCGNEVVDRIKPSWPQTEWSYNTWDINCSDPRTGAFASDPSGNEYISNYDGMGVQVVDASGNVRSVPDTHNENGWAPGYDVTVGSYFDTATNLLYQTDESVHEVQTLNTTTGAWTVLPFGLSGADM